MPAPAVGSAAVGLIGSGASARAQTKAANAAASAQSEATATQITESRRQFDTIRALMQPYVSAGNTALQGYLDLIGMGGTPGTTTGATPLAISTVRGQPTRSVQLGEGQDLRPKLVTRPGGVTGYQVGGQTFATMQEAQAYAQANGTGGTTTPGVGAQDAQQRAINGIIEGSQFRELTRQGEDAILASAAATGGLRGGNTQAALAQFRPAMLQSLIDKQLGYLGGLAGSGQNAAAGVGSAGLQTGQLINNATQAGADARMGAAIAGGRATTGAWNNIGAVAGDMFGSMQRVEPGAGFLKSGWAW